jgi:phytoene synthase
MAAPTLSPCAELVRKGDPDRCLAALTAPEAARERLFALYAFNLEVARAPYVVSEPMLGEIRLQWWRDSIDQIFAGGPVRRHEVVAPLAVTIRGAGLPRAPFDALIDARAFDLYDDPFPDRAAFDAYLDATAGGLMALAARALSPDLGEDGARAAHEVGHAAGLAALFRALPELISRGKAPLPAGAVPDRNALVEGRADTALSGFIAEAASDALERLRTAQRTRLSPAAVPALRAGWRAEALLRRAARPGVDPFRDFGDESEFARRASLLWRATRGTW